VPITRIECPECGAGLKSPSGFEEGQAVECPKCETSFTVEEPRKVAKAASRLDDDDDRPRKKKRRGDESERSYKSSPMRFAILGVLVVVMIVLGVMLVLKKQKEKEDANNSGHDESSNNDNSGSRPPVQGPPIAGPGVNMGPPPGIGGKAPFPPPGGGKFPNPGGKQPNIPGPGNVQPPPKSGGGNLPFPDIFGGAMTPAESAKIQAALTNKLLGTWEGTDPDGGKHTVTYQAAAFTHEVTGGKSKPSNGTWRVVALVGTKGLKLNLGNENAKVVFEDDELIHDIGGGQTVVLRKKS